MTVKYKYESRKKPFTRREKVLKKDIIKSVKEKLEPKNHLTSIVWTNVSFSGYTSTLFNPAQGTTAQTRVGDRAIQTYLNFRGRVMSNGTAGEYNNLRFILFYWKPDTAERTPLLKDILQASYAASAYTPLSPLVVGQEAKDITVIVDRIFDVNTDAKPSQSFHIKRKLNKRCYFNANNTSGANQLHVMVVSDDGVLNFPSIEYIVDVEFKDF